MRFTRRAQPFAASPAATLVAVFGVATLIMVVDFASALLAGHGPRTTPGKSARVALTGQPVPVPDLDPDLEPLVIEVKGRGDTVTYHVGARVAASPDALRQLLQPLARSGGAVSVRTSHDAPFARTAAAVAACRDAGFRTVLLVADSPPPATPPPPAAPPR